MSALSNGLRTALRGCVCGLALALVASCTPSIDFANSNEFHPEIWPEGQSGVARDPAIEAEVARILAQMTVEDKVGQIIQADVNSITPDEVRQYRLGSILNGGNSGPGGDDRAPAAEWLRYADLFYDASMSAYGDRIPIPIIWGGDAVHGNANVMGSTIFPHNIGLGAANNPELLRRIGEITAIEMRVVGSDWTFAPTIAVVRDDRWGRTYEGYSETPEIVATYAAAIVEGIQGAPGDADFLRGPHIIATAKHFLGDGGTQNGTDQGENAYPEDQLRDIFAPGYPAAINSGVQSVMASYNSWRGAKSHGNRALLNDILVERMGLDGFVVGDWNGHGQVAGCTPTSCAASFNAGLDMFMAPDTWRELYVNTLAQVNSGEITMARLDEAVSRILRVKLRAGMFEAGRPSARPYGGRYELLGSAEHRAVARQAVRESLVLLKNDNNTLPLRTNMNVLVAGDAADNMEKQTGGWTISWQGTGNSRADFPNAETIFEGIRSAVTAGGGRATLSVDGSFRGARPDVAVVVFGEEPYAEFQGDRETLDYQPDGATDLQILQRLQAQGIPVVAVFITGRPMYVTPELNASNAFIAAWLPGSEGGGIADMLFRAGGDATDFRGRLSFSWPRAPDQTPLNVGDANYNPLFAYGYGLTYAAPQTVGPIEEAAASSSAAGSSARYFEGGRASTPWAVSLVSGSAAPVSVAGTAATAQAPGIRLSRVDRVQQEDALLARWDGSSRASVVISGTQVDLSRQSNGEMALAVELRVDEAPTAPVTLAMSDGGPPRGIDITQQLRAAAGQGWTTIRVGLPCFADQNLSIGTVNSPFQLTTSGRMTAAISVVRLAEGEAGGTCPPVAQ